MNVASFRHGKSLLPAGVVRVEGMFARGYAVLIGGPDGADIWRGLVGCDVADAIKISGRPSSGILMTLGFGTRAEMVYWNDQVIGRTGTDGLRS
jgi:glutamate 5-kinase